MWFFSWIEYTVHLQHFKWKIFLLSAPKETEFFQIFRTTFQKYLKYPVYFLSTETGYHKNIW